MAYDTLIKVLHVGVANRGTWPLTACSAETGFVPWALCDTSREALEAALRVTGLSDSVAFTDYDEALETSGAECVIICTPTKYHVPMAIRAIDAGLPVLVEKGMAPDWESATRLVTAARDSGVPVAVSQNYRYGSTARTVKRAVSDPACEYYTGAVHHVLYWQNRVRPNPRTLDYPHGSVWDMSCHHFDNVTYWFGALETMTAASWRAAWSAYSYDHNTSAHIVLRNGVAVSYGHTHDAARISEEIQVHGDRGALFFRDGVFEFSERPKVNFGVSPVVPVSPVATEDERDLLRDFRTWLDGGPEPGISARANLETMACCEMMVRSLESGRPIRRAELGVG